MSHPKEITGMKPVQTLGRLHKLVADYYPHVELVEIPHGAYWIYEVPEEHISMTMSRNAKFGNWEMNESQNKKFNGNVEYLILVSSWDVGIDDFEAAARSMLDLYHGKIGFMATIMRRNIFDDGSLEAGLAFSFKESKT